MADQDDILKLIAKHQRRLQKLKERQAVEGIGTPPEVLTEIEDIEAEIERLRAKLKAEQTRLQQTLENLPELKLPGATEFQQQVKDRLVAVEQHLKSLRATSTIQYHVAGDLIQQAVSPPVTAPTELRRAYLHRLVQQTRRLPLAGVDPKAASDEGSRELQLAAVYTALLTQRPVERKLNLYPRETFPRRLIETMDEVRRLSAVAVLNREPCLVLLGEPGSGKSTFVNFVGLCLAGESLGDEQANLAALTAPLPAADARKEDEEPEPQPWNHGPLLPVRLVLRDLAARGLPEPGQPVSGDTLWTFIKAELGETLGEYAPHLKKELQEKGGLILLDGLDEVPDAHQRRMQVKQAVQGFAADFPRCRFLVTSRTYAYQRQDWKLDDFAEVVLSPFSPGQIIRFVDGWYAHISQVRELNPEDAQGQATLLKTAIERSARLSELATRPLLLTLMASLHAWRGGSLPEKREELYHDAVDLLLDQWESPKVVRDAAGQPLLRQPSLAEWLKVDKDVVRAALNRLAFEAHRDQPQLVGTADVTQERLVSVLMGVTGNPQVNPAQLVTYIRDRAGLLAARGEGVYTFPHRTFQEYLAACYLTDDDFPYQVADLLRTDPQRWREAALLAGAKAARGSASAAWNLADALCYREPPVVEDCVSFHRAQDLEIDGGDGWGALLAAQVLVENEGARLAQVSERNTPKLERIRRWLLAIIANGWLPPADRVQAGEALAVLGDERDFGELVNVPGGAFLMGDDRDSDASPQHELILSGFKIGRYPVTNNQYRRFVEATGRAWPSGEWQLPKKANCPVVAVGWHDALAYCAWLTEIWRDEGKIAADEEVRLPTEAQWEKAARGTDGRSYPWGEAWDETKCNTSELGLMNSCAVGMFPAGANPYGCLDMAGNVFEWAMSLWGMDWGKPDFKYPYNPTDGRENLEAADDIRRVLRGGSFSGTLDNARCAFRHRGNSYFRDNRYGFRVVVVSREPG
jgi:formylglycine-generating enzyme required for sulfatase activity